MVTIKECALFAKYAYSKQPSEKVATSDYEGAENLIKKNMQDAGGIFRGENNNAIYDGWTIFPPTKRICVFKKNKDYIIACRGTVPSDPYDILRDVSLGVLRPIFGRKNRYYKTERDRIKNEQVLPSRNCQSIETMADLEEICYLEQNAFYFVGHSLGGNIAELLASHYIRGGLNSNCYFVTFNGAGSGRGYGKQVCHSTIKNKGLNICTYYDFINPLGGMHAGHRYITKLRESYQNHKNRNKLQIGRNLANVFRSHGLNVLIDSMKGDEIFNARVDAAINLAMSQELDYKRKFYFRDKLTMQSN